MLSIRKSSRTKPSHDIDTSSSWQLSVKAAKKVQREQLLDECTFPRTGRRGAPQVFPRKLFQILEEEDEDVIGWTNNEGTSFTIYDMDSFTEHVLLKYFRHQKYSSFQRQLNLYGFHKISKGPETGAYAHDCFLRDKPEILMGVRRLPQRVAAAVSKIRLSTGKRNNKIVIKQQRRTTTKVQTVPPKNQGAFAKLTGCMKPRAFGHHHESSSDSYESYNSDDGDEESDVGEDEALPRIPPPPLVGFRDVIEDSVDSFAQGDDSFFGVPEDREVLDRLEKEIIQFQPLPEVCLLDNSAKVENISKRVHQLQLDQSPIAVAKTVKIPESSRSWAVQQQKLSGKPESPFSAGGVLQKMIPVLVRGGSSFMKLDTSVDNDMENSVIDVLENLEPVPGAFTRSKSSLMIEKIEKEFLPVPSNERVSSEAWKAWNTESSITNCSDQDFLAPNQLGNVFNRQESCDIVPPKPVEMER